SREQRCNRRWLAARSEAALLKARVRENVLHERREPARLMAERLQILLALRLVLDHVFREHLAVHLKRRQRRPKLVREGRRKTASLLAKRDAVLERNAD